MDTSPDAVLELIGRLHPLLLHVPIGALIALVALELFARIRSGSYLDYPHRCFLAVLLAVSAAATAGAGWILGREPGYAGDDHFWWHRALGLALTATTTLVALLAAFDLRRGYAVFLAVSLALLVPVGHNGATLTHGEGFLTYPLRASPLEEPAESVERPLWYATAIAPVLEERCSRCHGNGKHKGNFAIDDAASLAMGGYSGPAVIPGDAEASELVRRMRLPMEHDDHMPPSSTPQPSEAEIQSIERWIQAGASTEATIPLDEPLPAPQVDEAPVEVDDSQAILQPPTDSTLEALRSAQVHVEWIEPDSYGLWLDFSASPAVDDALLNTPLDALSEYVIELDLASSQISDAALNRVAALARLEHLNLADTGVTSAGLAALAGHPKLRVLNITRTQVDDGAVQTLTQLPALERVYAWNSLVTANGLLALDEIGSDISVALDIDDPADPIEVEPPVFLSAAPSPLSPVNATCPVTDNPVDPAFAIVRSGQVIGFCCSQCPTQFWSEPAKYAFDE